MRTRQREEGCVKQGNLEALKRCPWSGVEPDGVRSFKIAANGIVRAKTCASGYRGKALLTGPD